MKIINVEQVSPEPEALIKGWNSFLGVIAVLWYYLQIHSVLFIKLLLDYTIRFILLGKGAASWEERKCSL